MDKFLELKVIITFSIFVFFLIIERLLVYKEYKKKKRLISNFSLWFINGVSSYFIILPLTLFFTSLNFWERNTITGKTTITDPAIRCPEWISG